MENNKPQIFPCTFNSVACTIFNCHNWASHFIGRPDGPLNLPIPLCDNCLNDVITSLKEQGYVQSEIITTPVTPPEIPATPNIEQVSLKVLPQKEVKKREKKQTVSIIKNKKNPKNLKN